MLYIDGGEDLIEGGTEAGAAVATDYRENRYHGPKDEYDPNWNLEGMIEDAKVGFWTGLAIANADEMPTWNEGDEFEAVRLEALAAEED